MLHLRKNLLLVKVINSQGKENPRGEGVGGSVFEDITCTT